MRRIALLLVLVLAVAACGGDDIATTVPADDEASGVEPKAEPTLKPKPAKKPVDEMSSAEMLAVIDGSASAQPYGRLLDSLDAKCTENAGLIGDYAVKSRELLADDGVQVSILDALRGIDGSIPDGTTGMKCSEIAAAWVTLTRQQ
jgi:hypothetical protein